MNYIKLKRKKTQSAGQCSGPRRLYRLIFKTAWRDGWISMSGRTKTGQWMRYLHLAAFFPVHLSWIFCLKESCPPVFPQQRWVAMLPPAPSMPLPLPASDIPESRPSCPTRHFEPAPLLAPPSPRGTFTQNRYSFISSKGTRSVFSKKGG